MFVKRFFEPLVAQASYLIGCVAAGEAIVIDPNRDVDQYLDAARHKRPAHRPRHRDAHPRRLRVGLARAGAAGPARRCISPTRATADWKYDVRQRRPARSPWRRLLPIGNVQVQVMHTPGHTPEHLTFLITDGAAADQPIAAVTGDFVFVGDVGRPDLLERAAHIEGTMEVGARTLWKSLQPFDAAARLAADLARPRRRVGVRQGHQRRAAHHPRLRAPLQLGVPGEDRGRVRASVLAGQPEPPKYFATMKRVNKEGPAILGGFRAPRRLDDHVLEDLLKQHALVVDTRPAGEYAMEHLPGTINIPLNSQFVTWAGWLVPYSADLYLIVDSATARRMEEVVRALALIGIDRVAGYFGTEAIGRAAEHGALLGTVPQITADRLAPMLGSKEAVVIDVRSRNEWDEGHIPEAKHIPLGYLSDRLAEVPSNRPVVVQCQAGVRSAIAASLLRSLGRTNVTNLVGGFVAWHGEGLPVSKDGALSL